MTKASDNEFPSLLIKEGTVPASPAAGDQRLYIDSTAHAPKLVNSSGVTAFFPGYEYAYAEFTSNASITATTEATANTVVTAGAVAGDGSTIMLIEFFAVSAAPSQTAARDLSIFLYDGASSIGYLGYIVQAVSANADNKTLYLARRLTPSNASHTYSIRAAVSAGTGTISAGAGGAGANLPGFIRITKV